MADTVSQTDLDTAIESPSAVEGVVFDIQRFSIHDGPGIRTAVFLKGCSLRCFWCHNPESIHPKPEIQFYADRCLRCGTCLRECPQGACVEIDGAIVHQRERCTACGSCQDFCFAEALALVGRTMSVEQIMAEVLRDQQFYRNSGGGITLTGGEPVLQTAFSRAILQRCQSAGIHTAIETAGNYPWPMLEALLPFLDLVMMDLKHWNADKHQQVTGVSNTRILDNAQRLAATNLPLWFRTPVVPTVNDTEADIQAIASFVNQLTQQRQALFGVAARPIRYELLKFHRMAGDKYRSLDRTYAAQHLEPLSAERMAALDTAAQAVLNPQTPLI
jgi:pyruvate formate lyase activating enzyme